MGCRVATPTCNTSIARLDGITIAASGKLLSARPCDASMRPFSPFALLVLAAGLSGMIAWQLAAGPDATLPHAPAAAASAAVPRPAQEVRTRGTATGWAEAALARPLFRSDRRPATAAEAVPRAAEDLPRLTALLSGPFGRRAIFAGLDGRIAVVTEGSRLGGWTVLSIGVGAVSVAGRDGERTVRLGHGADAARSAPAPAADLVDDHAGGELMKRPTAGPMLPPPALPAGRR